MAELDVRIITLDPFIAVSFHGYGASPEIEAWTKTNAWLAESRLLEVKRTDVSGSIIPAHRADATIRYDVWVTVDDEFQPTGEVKMAACSGGRTRSPAYRSRKYQCTLADSPLPEKSYFNRPQPQWLKSSLT